MQAALEQEARIAGFKSEVTKSQELHLAGLTRDTERLTNNLEKIRAEIRQADRHREDACCCFITLASSSLNGSKHMQHNMPFSSKRDSIVRLKGHVYV